MQEAKNSEMVAFLLEKYDIFVINVEKTLPEDSKSDIMGVSENGRFDVSICLEIWRNDL